MASISGLGGGPCFSACLTIIMNCIVISPLGFVVERANRTVSTGSPRLYLLVDRGTADSTGQTDNSLTGRTSTLPTLAGGIFAANWMASFKSLASIR